MYNDTVISNEKKTYFLTYGFLRSLAEFYKGNFSVYFDDMPQQVVDINLVKKADVFNQDNVKRLEDLLILHRSSKNSIIHIFQNNVDHLINLISDMVAIDDGNINEIQDLGLTPTYISSESVIKDGTSAKLGIRTFENYWMENDHIIHQGYIYEGPVLLADNDKTGNSLLNTKVFFINDGENISVKSNSSKVFTQRSLTSFLHIIVPGGETLPFITSQICRDKKGNVLSPKTYLGLIYFDTALTAKRNNFKFKDEDMELANELTSLVTTKDNLYFLNTEPVLLHKNQVSYEFGNPEFEKVVDKILNLKRKSIFNSGFLSTVTLMFESTNVCISINRNSGNVIVPIYGATENVNSVFNSESSTFTEKPYTTNYSCSLIAAAVSLLLNERRIFESGIGITPLISACVAVGLTSNVIEGKTDTNNIPTDDFEITVRERGEHISRELFAADFDPQTDLYFRIKRTGVIKKEAISDNYYVAKVGNKNHFVVVTKVGDKFKTVYDSVNFDHNGDEVDINVDDTGNNNMGLFTADIGICNANFFVVANSYSSPMKDLDSPITFMEVV